MGTERREKNVVRGKEVEISSVNIQGTVRVHHDHENQTKLVGENDVKKRKISNEKECSDSSLDCQESLQISTSLSRSNEIILVKSKSEKRKNDSRSDQLEKSREKGAEI